MGNKRSVDVKNLSISRASAVAVLKKYNAFFSLDEQLWVNQSGNRWGQCTISDWMFIFLNWWTICWNIFNISWASRLCRPLDNWKESLLSILDIMRQSVPTLSTYANIKRTQNSCMLVVLIPWDTATDNEWTNQGFLTRMVCLKHDTYIVEIYHSGWKPLKCLFFVEGKERGEGAIMQALIWRCQNLEDPESC